MTSIINEKEAVSTIITPIIALGIELRSANAVQRYFGFVFSVLEMFEQLPDVLLFFVQRLFGQLSEVANPQQFFGAYLQILT